MLCMWWDQKGLVFYELLKLNETVIVDRYQQQLYRLNNELMRKRLLVADNRHSDSFVWQCATTFCKNRERNTVGARVGSFPVLSQTLVIWIIHLELLLFPIDATRAHRCTLLQLRKSPKIGWSINCFKRQVVLSLRNPTFARKMGKNHRKR